MRLVALAFVALCAAASSPAENLRVYAGEPGVTRAKTVLKAGLTYEITVRGRVFWDAYRHTERGEQLPGNWSDAEWFGGNWSLNSALPIVEGFGHPPGRGLVLTIDDKFVDWEGWTGVDWAPHFYSPHHAYKLWIRGAGKRITFRYADLYPYLGEEELSRRSCHGDDSGFFAVTITQRTKHAALRAARSQNPAPPFGGVLSTELIAGERVTHFGDGTVEFRNLADDRVRIYLPD